MDSEHTPQAGRSAVTGEGAVTLPVVGAASAVGSDLPLAAPALAQPSQAQAATYYVTVAIDYPNGEPHVGHAYEKVVADALVRYRRLRGQSSYYLAGNDEHSQNVLRVARARGVEPELFCAQMERVFRDAWDRLGVGYDLFMRTNDPRHVAAVQSLVQRLYDAGHVYRGTYRGWYCVSCEAFITEKEVADGLCPLHRRPLERLEEANWFFRLSAFRDAVLTHLATHPDFVQPEGRRHEIESMLREGLEDISVSRARAGWGVPLPWDSTQVVYVWFDALITYLSGAGFGWDEQLFAALWPADLHLIGKDIIRFHGVIWPAMLMAAGLPLPRTVFVHGFMNVRGERLSKTTGNGVDPVHFVKRYGRDATRYYLLAETPLGQDGNFAPESFLKRYNSDLANDLGNLLHRSLTMIERFSAGRVPEPPATSDDGFAAAAAQAALSLASACEGFRPHEGIAALRLLCARANKYIDQQAPWELVRRGDSERLSAVLYNLAEVLRVLAVALTPFLIDAPPEMARQLGLPMVAVTEARWTDLSWGGMRPGTMVSRGAPLFTRLESAVVLADRESFGGTRALPPVAEGETLAASEGHAVQASGAALVSAADAGQSTSDKERETLDARLEDAGAPTASGEGPEAVVRIGIEEFHRVTLRVATIRRAERVPGATRLLRLELDVGGAPRQIVSGIAEHYAPEVLVGRQVVIVANLEPATIRGVRSDGMLLAAGDGQTLRLVGPDGPIAPGSAVQ